METMTMAKFNVHVQFSAISIRVSAKNETEARRKVIERVSRRNIVKLIDHNNFFVDED